ncbi:putative quinol monooxygenase [Algoriphagus limi]|uniref:ABM domain-containing protein n=1 Tax=Algoriphagus limi TaxID=2975273 RepID=A0ABT2G1Z6_9BACT|nr:antibiotic biosynthesis monooxygenase [Algoriphagus limi]MCS5489285.1 hypothetical protein [Algoriphagus limi]
MKKITLCAKFHIHAGKESVFKKIIPQLIDKVKANEPGAETYNWYFNSDGTKCHVVETYSDSDAVMAHMGNAGELLGKLMAISDLSGDIYGNLSEELKAAMGTLPVNHFSFYQGL